MKQIRKILTMVLVFAVLAGTAYAAANATYTCSGVWYPIVVNGTPMTFTDAVPMNYNNGRTMLPLRAVSEAVGVPVEWDGQQVNINTVDLEALKDACVMVYGSNDGLKANEAGSGVLIDYDEVLTANHVIANSKYYYIQYDSSNIDNQCALADTTTAEDAAVLTPTDKTIKPVKIGDSDEVKVGDKIYIVSSPGEKKNTVTSGNVEQFGYIDIGNSNTAKCFTTTAATQGGSSGGAVFNMKGELIGIVDGGSYDGKTSNILPINDIRKVLAG